MWEFQVSRLKILNVNNKEFVGMFGQVVFFWTLVRVISDLLIRKNIGRECSSF